ncbi:MAG: DUF4397 domain-containing protein [Acidimicrobiales bacterium]
MIRRSSVASTASDGHRNGAGAARRRRRRRAVLLSIAALLAVTVSAGTVPAAAQAETSHIRLAHFSPDTPEMDVYLVGFDGEEQRVLEGLGYGEVSDYAALDPGSYSFLLRPMGAAADSPPAVTASADLEAGTAYTFAAMGPNADLQQALLTDDLAPPPAGRAKVRLIQASSSAGEVDVAALDGPVLAEDRPFASATEYAPVDAGAWTVRVSASGGSGEFLRQLDLAPGTVNTLVVLEGNGSGPDLTRVVDATGIDISSDEPLGASAAMPLGGVATGGGGAADLVVDGNGDGAAGTVDLTAALLVVGLVGAAVAVTVGVSRGLPRFVTGSAERTREVPRHRRTKVSDRA